MGETVQARRGSGGSGRSLAAATQCWIKTVPEATFGKEVSERVWIFSAADLKIFHGGGN